MIADGDSKPPVLVIGAGGQLGGAFVDQLTGRSIPALFASSQVRAAGDSRWCRVDILDADALIGLIERAAASVVINASAYTAVDLAENEQGLARKLNTDVPAILASACARNNATLIHFSTDYVFDGVASHAYTEHDATSPLNEYGRSKLNGERAVLDAGAHYVFRTSWLYAPGGRNFVATMLRLFQGESDVRVVNDQFGCPTAARDLASAIISWLVRTPPQSLAATAGLYHLCSQGECSWFEFAQAIRERAQPAAIADLQPVSSAQFNAPTRRPARSVLDCGLAREVLTVSLPEWRDALDAAMPAFNAIDAARVSQAP